ncbi:RTA1-domain-containing protein [Mycena latifolia]|nr:RTA1-domain-containing protein [Mycena latifolia]
MANFVPLHVISQLALRDNTIVAADDEHYGYVPHESIAILFLALFGISTILHVAQATYYRTWWLLPTAALCGVAELLGWSGRLWSSITPIGDVVSGMMMFFPCSLSTLAPCLLPARLSHPMGSAQVHCHTIAKTPFLIQISTTIMAPTPLLAANFIILSRLVQTLGTAYSWLTPKWYTILFLPCDIIALIVQGVGGGMASSAVDLAGANVGAHVMLGGIVFQFVAIIIFSTLASDFVLRYVRDRSFRARDLTPRGALTPRLKLMIAALAFSTTALIVRSVYRTIELANGWDSRIIHTEVYFNVLDGGMVVLQILY